jgi:hypothetical protein
MCGNQPPIGTWEAMMLRDERRVHLLMKLLRLTLERRIAWVCNDDRSSFSVEADGLKFELSKRDAFINILFRGRPLEVVGITVVDLESGDQLDIFSEQEKISGLLDLYEAVNRIADESDPKVIKIDAFLARDMTHAQ